MMSRIRANIRRAFRGMPWVLAEHQRDTGRLRLVSVAWEPRDLWIGCYWTAAKSYGWNERAYSVYLCALPTLVLRVDVVAPSRSEVPL